MILHLGLSVVSLGFKDPATPRGEPSPCGLFREIHAHRAKAIAILFLQLLSETLVKTCKNYVKTCWRLQSGWVAAARRHDATPLQQGLHQRQADAAAATGPSMNAFPRPCPSSTKADMATGAASVWRVEVGTSELFEIFLQKAPRDPLEKVNWKSLSLPLS